MRIAAALLLALLPGSAASPSLSSPWVPRGGSTKPIDAVRKYRMEQQHLMQIRSIILSEELAKRGIPIPSIEDVSTPAGEKQPAQVDWDCAMSTREEPKPCLYSFDAEENTKVLAPIDTDKWISVSALNQLRRDDPTKVEPMWNNQFAILESWFLPSSPYAISSALSSRPRALFLSFVLDHKWALRTILGGSLLLLVTLCLPVLEILTQRLLVSGLLWKAWPRWAKIAHGPLPLKLLMAQMSYKAAGRVFAKVEDRIRTVLIEMESQALEETLPLTVGPGSEVEEAIVEEAVAEEAMDDAEGGGEGDKGESESESESEDEYDEYDEYDDEF